MKSSIFVNLTPTGSFDKAILEAMACGDIVIVSNKAFERFLSQETASLVMFKEGDSTDLANKMVNVLKLDHERLSKLRHELRQVVVNHHSQKQWAQNLTKNLD